MSRLLCLLAVLGAVLVSRPAPLQAAPPTQSAELWLYGAEVHIGDGKVIEGGVIHVVGDTIRKVGGPELKSQIPKGVRALNMEGKIITPGLIAADSQLGLIEIGAENSTHDNSRTDEHPVRAAYDPASAINAESSLIQVQAIEGITTAAVAPTGGLISGSVAWIDLVHGDHAGIVAASKVAVDAHLGHGPGHSRAATLAHLRRVLDDARLYAHKKGAHDRRALRDLAAHPRDLEALAPVLARRIPLTLGANRVSDILAAIELAREYRIDIAIQGGREAWKVADELATAKVPVMVTPSANLPSNYDTLASRLENAAILSKAGVEVIIADMGEAHNIRNITQEAGIAVAYGMDREKALSALTLNVARAYGMEKRYGSLETGKVANIVVWPADPFELSSWPDQVYIRGAAIPMKSRQTLLRDRYLDLSKYKP
jgi:imidazolonepropionase-like amidohydrolase